MLWFSSSPLSASVSTDRRETKRGELTAAHRPPNYRPKRVGFNTDSWTEWYNERAGVNLTGRQCYSHRQSLSRLSVTLSEQLVIVWSFPSLALACLSLSRSLFFSRFVCLVSSTGGDGDVSSRGWCVCVHVCVYMCVCGWVCVWAGVRMSVCLCKERWGFRSAVLTDRHLNAFMLIMHR